MKRKAYLMERREERDKEEEEKEEEDVIWIKQTLQESRGHCPSRKRQYYIRKTYGNNVGIIENHRGNDR